MKAISTKCVGYKDNGKRIMEALITSDETPDELPVTGRDVIGMSEDECFAPMSIIYIIGNADVKVYIANESGMFIAQ